MPQASDKLRAKFRFGAIDGEGNVEDGIEPAEKVLRDAGCEIDDNKGIDIPIEVRITTDVWDAIDFLTEEYDYKIVKP
jgi:hypothetical protein